MKKTLFLSAILGAALCSSAFATTTALTSITAGDITVTGSSTQITSVGDFSTLSVGNVATFIKGNGRYEVKDDTVFANAGTIVIAASQLNGATATTTTGQLWASGQNNTDVTVSNALILGSSAYTEANAFGNAAIRMDSAATNSHVTLSGNIKLAQDAKIAFRGARNTISGAISGAKHTLTLSGYSDSLAVTSANVELGALKKTDGGTVTFGSAATDTHMHGTITAEGGTLTLNGTYTFTAGANDDWSKYTLKALDHYYAEDGTLITGKGVATAASGTYYAIQKTGGGVINVANTATINGATRQEDGSYTLTGTTQTLERSAYVVTSGYTATPDDMGTVKDLVLLGGSATISTHDKKLAFTTGDIIVHAGGELHLNTSDALGWSDGAVNSVTLQGDSNAKQATMTSTGTQTLSTNINLKGHSTVSGSELISLGGKISATGTNNTISSGIQIRDNITVDVAGEASLTLSGAISLNMWAQTPTLTKTGDGTLAITGNISAGTINGGNLAKTTISGNTISGGSFSNATINRSTISGGSFNMQNVNITNSTITGNITLTGGQWDVNNGRGDATLTLSNGAKVNASDVDVWINNGKTLTVNGNGSVTMRGILSGVSASALGNLNVGEGSKLTLTGTAATDNLHNGLIIWSNAAHVYAINGELVVEGGIRAQRAGGAATLTSTNATFNVGSTGLLQLNKGITFVSDIVDFASLGTINVKGANNNGGTLAIGGQTTGSKATVNLQDGSKVVAIDEATSTQQVFTLDHQATVTFSAKGLDGTADNTLTVDSAIDNGAAAVNSIGKVNFRDMNTVRLTVDGTTTVGTLTTPKVIMKADASLTMAGADTEIKTLTLNGGSAVTIGSAAEGRHDYDLTTTTLTVAGASTINANLVVSNNGKMDFSGALATGSTLTMGCSVEIGDNVTVVIDESIIEGIVNRGETVAIIDGVDEEITSLGSWNFVSLNSDGTYKDLSYANLRLEDAGNGTIVVAPEPATATLSLLALAALAARRKRH